MTASAKLKQDSAMRDLDITKQAVASAESRARLQMKTNSSKPLRGNNRQYAQALHRQADELCQRGEYESALVLYHRAATVCPHDSSHSVAARRTAATISSWNNPEKSSTRLSTSMRNDTISRVISCPENAAHRAHNASKSFDLPLIPGILKHLDIRKKVSRETFPAPRSLTAQLTRSQTRLKHINSHADAMLKNLEANFNAGKMRISLRLAEDLLTLSIDFEDPRRHRIPAYHYLSLIHVALGRHDRAANNVAALVRLSKSTNDAVVLSRALVTLGKVHLSFGCFEAAARAWEKLSIHVSHPVPRAWLHHEIGRCHFERGKYVKAMRKAMQCRECAEEANSKKWTFHAELLKAQCLAMLGRFAEAFEELRVSAKISEEEGDTAMLSYIRDLIEQLNRALREVTFGRDRCSEGALRRLSPREELRRSEGSDAITFGIKRTVCNREDALTLSSHSDYMESKIVNRCEIDEESSSWGSALSSRSKKTNLTYVIKSHTDFSIGSKLDEMKIYDTELLPCESHMTFATCHAESKHFIDEEKTSAALKQSIQSCSSNVEISGGKTECDTFRISRSCNLATISDGVYRNGILCRSESRKQDDEEMTFDRERFSLKNVWH